MDGPDNDCHLEKTVQLPDRTKDSSVLVRKHTTEHVEHQADSKGADGGILHVFFFDNIGEERLFSTDPAADDHRQEHGGYSAGKDLDGEYRIAKIGVRGLAEISLVD